MEMDLAPFVGVVFDTILFAFVFGISSVGAIFIWLFNRDSWKELGTFKVLGQATASSWLDTGLVAGILGTSLGMMGVVSGNAVNTDIDLLYSIMPLVLGTFLWGGLLTGAGYCLIDRDLPISYKIRAIHLLPAFLIILLFLMYQIGDTGLPVMQFFTNPYAIGYYAITFLSLIILVTIGFGVRKPLVVVANNANLVATLGGMAMGISLWFVEGADYEASKDAIYFIANILMLGSLVYLFLYLLSLLFERSGECNYQTKSWHFAEATAFFLFLVYAPVGTTEYLRESTDQANQQANNEAQQLEINQLKAQIKLLTEKVGEA